MTEQVNDTYTKEYLVSKGVLFIENIFNKDKPKADIVKEIIESTAYLGGSCSDDSGPPSRGHQIGKQ